MGLAALKTHRFSSADTLCSFVNSNSVSVIENIIAGNDRAKCGGVCHG